MTKNQIKFLKVIYNKEKTAAELCKELKTMTYNNDPIGGYYNTLNRYIDYLTSDYKNEIEDMFEIRHCNGSICNNDIYIITSKGKTYIENYKRDFNRYIIVTIVIAVIQLA